MRFGKLRKRIVQPHIDEAFRQLHDHFAAVSMLHLVSDNRNALVNQAIAHLRLNRVIVAHRPDTIASADRVIHLRDGQVVTENQQVTGWPRAVLAQA